ncbi:MAG: FliH/SctL family protein [Pseudomonadota bacterium]
MSEYEKFVFPDLLGPSVVNKVTTSSPPSLQDEMIADVIAQHLETIVPNITPGECDNLAASSYEATDIEKIKAESYEEGRQSAEAELQPLIEKLKAEFQFTNNLQAKLDLITKSIDIEEQMAKLTCDLVQNIARKLYLTLPTDFERIFVEEISTIIKKFYKEGKITVRVHADMVDRCNNFLGSTTLPSNSVEVVVDEDLCNNDCIVEWGETRLEYSQEDILAEVERIVSELQPNL